MELKDIVHVSGKPGLYKIVAHGKNNIIVESLDDAKTRTSVSVSQRFSVLDDIAMYTSTDDIKLREVLVSLNEKAAAGLAIPDAKSDDATLKAFFESVVPEYDRDRVHASDIKKLINWYNLLKSDLDFEALKNAKDEEDKDTSEVPAHDKHKNQNTIKKDSQKVSTKAISSANKTSINRKTV